MTPIQYVALKQELQSDPMQLGYGQYVAIADYASAANLLNTQSPAFAKSIPQVPIAAVLMWAAGGPLQKLTDYGNNVAGNSILRSICLAAVKMFGACDTLDLSHNQITTMLQTLVGGGILTATDQAGLLALQFVSPASRAEALFGPGAVIQPFDVQTALR